MANKSEVQSSSLDTIKLVGSIILLLLAMAGFYAYSEQSLLYRVLALLAVVGVAASISLTTSSGKRLASFMKDARIEVRKMVWPTRAETIQVTLMVFVMVIILSIFLWLVDMLLGWSVQSLLGMGK